MIVYRITRRIFARTWRQAFDGRGAALAGGRWNRVGVRVAYASTSLSLATLEYLAAIGDRRLSPGDLVVATLQIPDNQVADGTPLAPKDWRRLPPPRGCADVGDTWIAEARSLALLVPSVLLPLAPSTIERNVLVNPRHPAFARIRTGRINGFSLDPRLRTESKV